MSIFKELKRRNVIRVAIAYAVVSWLVLQVANTLVPVLELSPSVTKTVLLILLLGFIPAMFFSWAFEITPEGVKKEKDVARDESVTNLTAKKLDYVTLVAAVGVLGLFVYQQMRPPVSTPVSKEVIEQSSQDAPTTVKESDLSEIKAASIAVLPFVNMSSDKEQEYFADGISEEILNVLVRIPKLKVAGRTSSFSFKGKNEDLRIIGDALGVNHILEGSVRRSGTKLRITAQLIRSEDGFHLWSDTYDREFEDIFDIQDEISQKVAEQLAIKLGLNAKHKVHERTDDLVVYENYLKAKQLFLLRGKDNLDEALVLLNEATTRDPNFAPAWTYIAFVYGVYEAYSSEEDIEVNYKAWRAAGKQAAQRAVELEPESGEAHAAQGVFYFYNFELIKSFDSLDRALKLEPDNANVLDTVVQHLLLLGYFKEAQELSAKSVAIDPLVAMYRNLQGGTNGFIGNDEAAIVNLKKSIELDPSLFFPYANLFLVYSSKPEYLPEIAPLINKAFSNNALKGQIAVNFTGVLKLLDNKTLLADKTALREHALQSDNKVLIRFISKHTADAELLINKVFLPMWSDNYDYGPDLFPFPSMEGFYQNKHFKEQVKKDGVLALWQSRGFPAHCKPVGEDDFECDLPTQ